MPDNDLGPERPDCAVCKKEKSAVMLINGKMMCPQCIYKYDAFVKEQNNKMMEGFIDANTQS